MSLADVLGHGRQLETLGRHRQSNGRSVPSLPDEPYTIDCGAELVARHRQLVRVPARDELLVVREVALDQTGGHGRASDPEHDLALGQHDLDLLFAEQSLNLTESLAR